MGSVLSLPVYETPSVGVLVGRPAQSHVGQGTEQYIGDIDGKESEPCQLLIHIMVVEIGMVNGQIPFYRHGTNDTEPRQPKEKEDEGTVFTQFISTWPAVLQVCGNSDGTHQTGPQQVSDCQSTHQGIKSGLLLLLPGLAKHYNGNQVAHHPKDEHDSGDRGRGPAAPMLTGGTVHYCIYGGVVKRHDDENTAVVGC